MSSASTTTRPNGRSCCASTRNPRSRHSTDLVDIGWHTFLLHTRDYAEFCDRIAGRFIHHEPEDGSEWPTTPTTGAVPLTRAVEAITSAGYQIDRPLWRGKVDCTQCHAGCTDSPTR